MRNKRLAVLTVILLQTLTASVTFAQQKIFWTDPEETAPSIHCANTDGTSCKDGTSNTTLISLDSMEMPYGIAVDEVNQKIVWVDNGSVGSILRANFDGTGKETIVSSQIFPQHLAIDYTNGKLYWTTSSGVFRSNLDGGGSSVEQVSGITGFSFTGLAIDSTNGVIFWSDSSSATSINKSSLSAISQTNILYLDGIESVFGLAVNPATTSLYWVARDSSKSDLEFISSYAPSSIVNSLLPSLPGANYTSWRGIALDYPEQNVYYANSADKKIYKSSLIPASAAANVFLNTSGEVNAIALSCGRYAIDTDGDGSKDCSEACDNDPLKTSAGICGCGTPDTDSDGDGTADCLETCDSDPLKIVPGVCGCGLQEVDTDKDGILDCNDACPTDGEKTGAGTCGCGVEDVDSDNDGTLDCDDACPEDERKTEAGLCGCGLIEDINSDGKEVCVQNRQLTPNTKIENPPIIEVIDDPDSDTAEVTIILEKFVKPTLTLKKKKNKKGQSDLFKLYEYGAFAAGSGLKVTYEIQLTKTDAAKKEVKKLTSKKNQLTVKNLKAGNYEVKYRAIITDDGEAAAKTKYSPGATFTLQ